MVWGYTEKEQVRVRSGQEKDVDCGFPTEPVNVCVLTTAWPLLSMESYSEHGCQS